MTIDQLISAASKTAIFAAAGLILNGASAALAAQDCNAEVGVLMKKRMDMMASLNENAKANKGKLDPVAGCVKLRALVSADRAIEAYFKKNKEWCSIPDEATANMTADIEKTTAVAAQACSIADKMKKQQEQQAAGGGLGEPAQKLPTGPL
jgi:hypothetical protein